MLREISEEVLNGSYIKVQVREVDITKQGMALVEGLKQFRRATGEIPKKIIVSEKIRLFKTDRGGDREFFGIQILAYPDICKHDAYIIRYNDTKRVIPIVI